MNVKFVDGLVEQLKGQTPLQEMDGNPIYTLMQEKTLDAAKLAKIVRGIHEHRPMVEDRLGDEKQSEEKSIRVMTDATTDMAFFAVVNRKAEADGSYGILAKITISKGANGKWGLDDFLTALDPTGYDQKEARQYVNLAEGIKKAYKGNDDKFVADFMQGLSKNEDVWGALTTADNNSRIDNIFDGARKEEQQRLDAGEKAISVRKIVDGRMPGTYAAYSAGETSAENRTSTAAVLRHKN